MVLEKLFKNTKTKKNKRTKYVKNTSRIIDNKVKLNYDIIVDF
jgi:hypothetical protein